MKGDKDWLADYDAGLTWESELFEVLSRYIHDLDPPKRSDTIDGKIVGGFSYRPDMRARSFIAAQSGHDSRFYAGVSVALEAKIRLCGFHFSGADDFPYPTIIVNEVFKTHPAHLTERDYLKLSVEDQKAYMRPFHSYWIASSDKQCVAVICPATKPLWSQESVYSRKDRRPALNWVCPIKKPSGGNAVLFGRFPRDVPRLLTYL